MNTIDYLRNNTLDSLSQFGISVNRHPTLPLAILNYSQIDSPKFHPIADECRGLVIDYHLNTVVSRAFNRFYNYEENPNQSFNWNNFTTLTKEDGSLILIYYYNGEWRVNTRNSFGDGEVGLSRKSWADYVYKLGFGYELDPAFTYVCEFCSPYNKVVRHYPKPQLYLLTIFENATGLEWFEQARLKDWPMPDLHHIKNVDELKDYVEHHPEATFEGLVVRDSAGNRIKLKNSRYVALHHLSGNGDRLNSIKCLTQLILKGEQAEALLYFPEIEPLIREIETLLDKAKAEISTVYENSKFLTNRRDFAKFVLTSTAHSGMLFKALDTGRPPLDFMGEFETYWVKWIKEQLA